MNIVYAVEQESVQQLQMICSNKFVHIGRTGIVHANDSSDHPRKSIINPLISSVCYSFRMRIPRRSSEWTGRWALCGLIHPRMAAQPTPICILILSKVDMIIACGNKTVAVNLIRSQYTKYLDAGFNILRRERQGISTYMYSSVHASHYEFIRYSRKSVL